jgi:cytochrome b
MSDNQLTSYTVWDRMTRIFHWVNFFVLFALLTVGLIIFNGSHFGFSAEGRVAIKALHVTLGYIFAVNLSIRIIWGFIGGKRARWSRIFPFSNGFIGELKTFIAGLRSGNEPKYLGHNPLGRIIISLMIICMITMAATGLVIAGTDIYYPPFGQYIIDWIAIPGTPADAVTAANRDWVNMDAYKEMREFRKPILDTHIYGMYTLCTLMVLHIFFVIKNEVQLGGGIISAMFTGKKVHSEEPVDKD